MQTLDAELIDEVLALLEDQPSFESTFLREAMRGSTTATRSARWKTTLRLWQRTRRAQWTDERDYVVPEATLAALLVPENLAACQAATVSFRPPIRAMAALIRDGSEASLEPGAGEAASNSPGRVP